MLTAEIGIAQRKWPVPPRREKFDKDAVVLADDLVKVGRREVEHVRGARGRAEQREQQKGGRSGAHLSRSKVNFGV